MLRAMYSAVSGLRSHMSYMDVVGNNIANVNTIAYKSARATFQDVLSQTIRNASAPVAGGLGGINPMQIGLGVNLAAVTNVMTQGAPQATGRVTDLAIQGTGFFVVSDGTGRLFYTRDGAFDLDAEGFLVNASGYRVQGLDGSGTGIAGDIQIDLDDGSGNPLLAIAIDSTGMITATYQGGATIDFGPIALATFVNPGGLERMGENLWGDTANSGTPAYGQPGTGGLGTIWTGTLEGSNVDLAYEFTNMILAQRGFQANSRVITASDQILQDLVNIIR